MSFNPTLMMATTQQAGPQFGGNRPDGDGWLKKLSILLGVGGTMLLGGGVARDTYRQTPSAQVVRQMNQAAEEGLHRPALQDVFALADGTHVMMEYDLAWLPKAMAPTAGDNIFRYANPFKRLMDMPVNPHQEQVLQRVLDAPGASFSTQLPTLVQEQVTRQYLEQQVRPYLGRLFQRITSADLRISPQCVQEMADDLLAPLESETGIPREDFKVKSLIVTRNGNFMFRYDALPAFSPDL